MKKNWAIPQLRKCQWFWPGFWSHQRNLTDGWIIRKFRPFWVFPKIGVKPPKWMVKIMENLIKMGWFGGKTHYFRKHPSRLVFEFWRVWIWRSNNKWPDQGPIVKVFLWQPFFLWERKKQDPTCGFFGKWLISSKLWCETAPTKKHHKFRFVDSYNVARKFKSPENTAMKVKSHGTNIQLLPLHCKFVVWLPSKPTTCETSLRSQTQTKRLLV